MECVQALDFTHHEFMSCLCHIEVTKAEDRKLYLQSQAYREKAKVCSKAREMPRKKANIGRPR